MTGRRAPRVDPQFLPDPLAAAAQVGDAITAVDLADIIASFAAFDQSSIRGYLFRKPRAGFGKFENLEQVAPPFEHSTLIDYVRTTYGGGEYRLQLIAGGKPRANFEFILAGKPKPLPGEEPPAVEKDPLGGMNIIALMMQQQAEARREMAEQQRRSDERQAEYQRQADERQSRRDTALIQAFGIAVPVLAPLVFGGREKLSDLVTLMNANKPEATSLKDTVETMVLVKKLFGDDKAEGFDPSDIAGSLARIAGPIAAAAGRAFGRPAQVEVAAAPAYDDGDDGHLHLPPPAPGAPAAAPGAPIAASTSPVLTLIRPDVLYFYSRQLDPALAAEAVVDVMARAGVSEDDVNALVAAFGLSPDWKADLAAQGLDLRGNPEWADEFLAELVDAWPDRDQHGDGGAGGTGGVANPAPDAEASAPGLAVDGDTRASA